MPSRCLLTAAALLTVSTLSAPVSPQEREGRSFVGKKLPAVTFIDTEGHRLQPAHYLGSVLVMVTGIGW